MSGQARFKFGFIDKADAPDAVLEADVAFATPG